MRQWVPVSSSAKGRLVVAALEQFGTTPYGEVTVGGVTSAAGVTTGALYHHFGGKPGLYTFVRADVEQRVIDRMAGAVAATAGCDQSRAVTDALAISFDFAVQERFLWLLGETPGGVGASGLAEALTALTGVAPVTAVIVIAAWRAALIATADGVDPAQVRTALRSLSLTTAAPTTEG